MGIEEIFIWYQRKIGTYDKQLWETKIEQREQRHYGLTHVQMRSAKPNTDLIDLDLVRGSSFTKAKPQHGFFKVTRMATLRCLLMPFYAKWWIRQTSSGFFAFTLFLYLVQLENIAAYYIYTSRYCDSSTEIVSCMEIVIPILMGWLLSLIHSQIVSTIPDKKDNPRRPRKKLQFADDIENLKPESRSKKLTIRPWFKSQNVDDDGFESFTGNGSRTSEEDLADDSTNEKIVEKANLSENEDKIEAVDSQILPLKHENPVESDSSCRHCKRGSQDQDLNSEENSENCHSCNKCENWVQQLKDTVSEPVCSTDSESEGEALFGKFKKQPLSKRRNSVLPTINVTSALDSTCDTENEALSSPRDWTAGVTTNSEDCSSDLDDVSDAAPPDRCSDCFVLDGDANALLTPPTVKASCTIYKQDEIKKADLSMLDISSIIISRVEAMPSTHDYFYAGVVLAAVLSLTPLMCRLTEGNNDVKNIWEACKNETHHLIVTGSPLAAVHVVVDEFPKKLLELTDLTLGTSPWERSIIVVSMLQRFVLASIVFFLLAVAERTFKQRVLYAKLFSHLTSSRRARKSDIPHFRLNKVRNIKTWLSVRSYLKKRGPQRSVDVIVSSAFVVTLLLLAFLCAELLKDTVSFSQYYLEAMIWCLGLGIMLLRFMTLGTKINKKYRNLSVLITEQINLHLQIEQKPHKKDELNVANNVLKLAIDLLKELENPFKISGLSANPILYNITKLVILSALSGVLSEMLGFKLKLHKIKLK
ncbi:putative homeodomain transcription factor isoform X2 [Sitophilus oryzae]|uniref:Homeodomain transcription factor isoform X2 n=1 Tax=Sitophilus oryzae TaxID=7048 RepID=A0A6J2Y3I1_SITOR|nr:putative homeodomain transcription factor isoform X2 [Sitophilus oryzae]